MLSVSSTEHDEDLARIGPATWRARSGPRQPQEPVGHRLAQPLFRGCCSGTARRDGSAGVVFGAFERELDEKALLAFFLPAVV